MTGGVTSADHLLALVKLGTKVNVLERCRVLTEAKQVYVRLHPETRHGGKLNKLAPRLGPPTFVNYAADLIGCSGRSICLAIAIWNGLSPDSRARLSGLAISDNQRELQALSRLSADHQRRELDRLMAGEIDTFGGSVGIECPPPAPDLTRVSRRDLVAELWRRETSNG